MASSPSRRSTGSDLYAYQRAMMEQRIAKRQAESEFAISNAVNRDPCVGCQVPADRHDQHGCKRYIPRR